MAKLAELVQHKERNTLGSLRRPDGSITSDGLETLQILAATHFPFSTPVKPQSYGPTRITRTLLIQNQFSSYVSPLLTKRSLKKFKPYKAPGPDSLKPIIPWDVFVFISFLYDCCLFFWYTPRLWQETNVIFIFYLNLVRRPILIQSHFALFACPTIFLRVLND